jgi:hypothetical protein
MSGTEPGTCTTLEQGGPGSCKDVSTWKEYAYKDCIGRGLTLTDYLPQDSCGGQSYQSVIYACCSPVPTSPPAVVNCEATTSPDGASCKTCYDVNKMVVSNDCSWPAAKCEATTSADGVSCKTCYDVNGKVVSNECSGTAPSACFQIIDGGPTSCKDAGTWKMYGAARCDQQKATLVDVKPITMCAGGIEQVAYTCCPVAPTPVDPSPVKCESTMDAQGVCKTCYDATGMIIAQDCAGPAPTTPTPMCAVSKTVNGTECKTCYYADGSTVSDCPPTPTTK